MLVVSMVVAYFIGSISTSTLLSKWFAGIDIRDHGSGNAGATNILRVLGWRYGVAVFIIDVLKGVIAVLIATLIGHSSHWYTYLSGLAVVIGHNWPIFFRFRGGKGIATTVGVLLVLLPIPVLLAGIVTVLLLVVTRFVSLASLALVVLTPVIAGLKLHSLGAVVFSTCIAVLAVYRHRQNISRLLKGKEHRIFSKV